MKKSFALLVLSLISGSFIAFGQELPNDILDANTAFILKGIKGSSLDEPNLEIVESALLIEGVNLVACNDVTYEPYSTMATYDYLAKEVKYIIKLEIVQKKEVLTIYQARLTEGNVSTLFNPKKTDEQYRIWSNQDDCIDQLITDLQNFKTAHPNAPNSACDGSLIRKTIIPENQKQNFDRQIDAQTLRYGLNKKLIKHLPGDLANTAIAYVEMANGESNLFGVKNFNSEIVDGLKSYPNTCLIFNNYAEFESMKAAKAYKYRLLFTTTLKVSDNLRFDNPLLPQNSAHWSAVTLNNPLFVAILYDIENKVFYQVSSPEFKEDVAKNFIKRVKENQ